MVAGFEDGDEGAEADVPGAAGDEDEAFAFGGAGGHGCLRIEAQEGSWRAGQSRTARTFSDILVRPC